MCTKTTAHSHIRRDLLAGAAGETPTSLSTAAVQLTKLSPMSSMTAGKDALSRQDAPQRDCDRSGTPQCTDDHETTDVPKSPGHGHNVDHRRTTNVPKYSGHSPHAASSCHESRQQCAQRYTRTSSPCSSGGVHPLQHGVTCLSLQDARHAMQMDVSE